MLPIDGYFAPVLPSGQGATLTIQRIKNGYRLTSTQAIAPRTETSCELYRGDPATTGIVAVIAALYATLYGAGENVVVVVPDQAGIAGIR